MIHTPTHQCVRLEERRAKKERRAKDVVMEILLDVVMEKNSLEKRTSLSTHVGTPGPASWASPPPTGDRI